MSRAHAPFLGVLTRPTETNYRAGGMGPPGAHVNQFADNAPAFPGTSIGLGMSGGTGGYVKGLTDYYDWTTNGFSTYHVSQTLGNHSYGDTGQGQFIFGRSAQPSERLESDQRLHGQDLYSVSILNYLMQHEPSFRKKFGSMTNSADVMKYWNYKGVQIPAQDELNANQGYGSKPISIENGLVISGRVRVPNIFLAENKDRADHVGEGMTVFLLLRRHPYVGDQASREESWKPKDPVLVSRRRHNGDVSDVRSPAERSQPAYAPDPVFDATLMCPGFDAETAKDVMFDDDAKHGFGTQIARMDRCMDHGDNKEEEAPGQQYYWSFDPYVSKTGTNPDPEYYVNRYGKGMYISLGLVHHSLRGPNNYTAEQASLAQKALYPAQRGTDYLIALHSLDVIELHLKMGQKFT